jgi:hypothetical protein
VDRDGLKDTDTEALLDPLLDSDADAVVDGDGLAETTCQPILLKTAVVVVPVLI